MKKNLIIIFALWIQFFLAGSAFALMTNDSGQLCSAFKDVELEQSFISKMLEAASNGTLYKIRPETSKAGFCVRGPMGMVKAEFRQFQGGVALPDARSQQAAALVSLDVNSLESNSFLADSLLKSDGFLDAEAHPKITFVGKDVVWISPTKAVIKGELSMHGVTREVAFYIEFSASTEQQYSSDTVRIKASTTISRSEFGLNAFAAVDDKVNLCLQVDAQRYYVEPL